MAWLSLAMQLPGNTLDSFPFAQFARMGTQAQWSYCFLVWAMIGVVGLLTNIDWVRLASVFCLATTHGIVAYCFYLSWSIGDPVITGVGTYAIIAGLGYYLVFRRFIT